MSREQALELLKLLSALESWSFATNHPLPDYLHEKLAELMEVLQKAILK